MDNNKYSLLLTCGPRELEIFNKIKKDLKDATNEPQNRNEIVRRGLQSYRYLVETDNSLLMSVLSKNLKILIDDFTVDRFDFVKNLSLVIYSSMICKRGISESELFEPIVLNMESIDDFKKHNILDEKAMENIHDIIDHMTKSIDIIFLGKMDMASKFKTMASYYDDKAITTLRSPRYQMFVEQLLRFLSVSEPKYKMKATVTESISESVGEIKGVPSSSGMILQIHQ